MDSLNKIELPISELTCDDCRDEVTDERARIHVPFHATSVVVQGDDDLEPLTVTLDVSKISWRKQSAGRYVATATVTVSCPCCEKARDIQPYLEAPSILITNIGKCRTCKGNLEIEEEEINYLDSGSGHWKVDVRADLICRTCSTHEAREIYVPVKSWDEFGQAKELKVSLTDSPSRMEAATRAKQVFISYSHNDDRWLARLQVHLKPLERHGVIIRWDDTLIKPGTNWREEIQRGLESAKAAILLVSADFLASDFINNNELPPLLASAKFNGVIILPIIVSPCRFAETKALSQFQAVNPPSQPLSTMTKAKQEAVFVEVTKAVEKAFES
jgi:TIR domain